MIIEATGLGHLMKGKGVIESEIHIRMISEKRKMGRTALLYGRGPQRMRLSVRFAMRLPASWMTCTSSTRMMTDTHMVTGTRR